MIQTFYEPVGCGRESENDRRMVLAEIKSVLVDMKTTSPFAPRNAANAVLMHFLPEFLSSIFILQFFIVKNYPDHSK